MADPCITPAPPAPCVPAVTDSRVLQDFTRRFNAATRQALVAIPPHNTNNDESLPDKCGTYTKCIKQDSPGKVNPGAYTIFRNALNQRGFLGL